MLKFYEMVYYAIYRQQLEGKSDGTNFAARFYSLLIFLNASTVLVLLNAILRWQGIFIPKAAFWCFLTGAVVGLGMNALMNSKAPGIKRRFEDKDWPTIATRLLVYIIASLVFFSVIVWGIGFPEDTVDSASRFMRK